MLKSVQVRDYMTHHQVTFRPETDLFLAIERLLEHRLSGAPVVNAQGHLLGMLSESDCLRGILSGAYYDAVGGVVGACMQAQLDSVSPDEDVVDVCQRLLREQREALPVVERGVLVGVLSRRDALRAIKAFAQHDASRLA